MPPLRRDWMLLPVVALLPLLLYVGQGYGGHDFSFHVTSWIELHNAWRAHERILGWSQWAQYGFGEPRFCFYPPFSFLIGAGLSFLMPLRLVPGIVAWMVLSVSGLAMYLAGRKFLPGRYRLLAAILYMFNPYLLGTVIIRYDIAEAWVQALLPLTILYSVTTENSSRHIALLGCLLAFGWLTNIPAAIALFYSLGLLAVVLSLWRRSWQPLLVMVLGQMVALALAAFRLIPAWHEKAWVSSQALLIYNFKEQMPFHQVGSHMFVLFCTIYMTAAFALALAALGQSVRARKSAQKCWSAMLVALTTLIIVAVFVELPISTFLWDKLPEFKFVVFPFRFLSLLSFASTVLIFEEGVSEVLRKCAVLAFLALATIPFFAFGRLLPYQLFPSFQAALSNWQKGFQGLREYVPVTVPPDRAEPGEEVALHAQGPFASSACHPMLLKSFPDEKVVRTLDSSKCTLTLNTFYYPFWEATLEDGSLAQVSANTMGLLTVLVPEGQHQVTLRFLPKTRMRSVAAASSLMTALAVLLWILLPRASVTVGQAAAAEV